MFHRGSRGMRRRSGPRPVIQSFKKVIFFIDASFGAGFTNDVIATGADSIAAGQTSSTDTVVSTGSILKYFEIQFACINPADAVIFVNCTIQYRLANQAFIDPNLMGGSNQRNQCLHMDLFSVGHDQNSTHKFKFKIPKQFQRMREGMVWSLTWRTNGIVNRQAQMIYKFYR